MRVIFTTIILTLCTFSSFSQSFKIKESINPSQESYFTIYSIENKNIKDSVLITNHFTGGITNLQSHHVSNEELLIFFEAGSAFSGATFNMMRLKIVDHKIRVESEFKLSKLYNAFASFDFVFDDNELRISKGKNLVKVYSLSVYYDLEILAEDLLKLIE